MSSASPYPSPAAPDNAAVDYSNDSHPEAMNEDSDATEGFYTAPLPAGVHAEWRELVEYARSTLPVAYRSDGPQLAFVFDDPPSPDGEDRDDMDAPIKRKRVMVDGYEMEDDGEDGMNVRTHCIAESLWVHVELLFVLMALWCTGGLWCTAFCVFPHALPGVVLGSISQFSLLRTAYLDCAPVVSARSATSLRSFTIRQYWPLLSYNKRPQRLVCTDVWIYVLASMFAVQESSHSSGSGQTAAQCWQGQRRC